MLEVATKSLADPGREIVGPTCCENPLFNMLEVATKGLADSGREIVGPTCCENPLFDMLEVATKSKLATKSEFPWLLPMGQCHHYDY